MAERVLILSWEYPPVVEGGLARHVRKLSEALVGLGMEVHVLTRGDDRIVENQITAGVHVHRVRESRRPEDLGEFVTWIEHMNADMLAAGVELGDRYDFDLLAGHDWLVAVAGEHLANRFRCPLVVTIHATEYGR
ncbi:MAG: glycogen/starch synthase, partial [Solirubrobacteraceae bacterium]